MKRIASIHLLVAGGVMIFLNSCYPSSTIPDPYYVSQDRQKENYYYLPPAANAPLLTEKGDVSATFMASSGKTASGAEIQAAGLPSKHIGVLASFSTGTNKSSKEDYTKHHQFELGAGYVTKFAHIWSFETYGGWGSGDVSNRHHTGSSKINANHFFLQPTIAVANKNRTVQLGMISKFSGVTSNMKYTFFDKDREQFSAAQIAALEDEPFHLMWEPGIAFRAGWRNVLFNAQYSHSSDLTNENLHREKDNFSLGIILKFNAITD